MAALTGWKYRCSLSSVAAKVGVGGVSDFPAVVTGANVPAAAWAQMQSDGRDLRVTAADGVTVLPHELVSVDTTAQTLQMWPLCQSLLSSSPVGHYLYWGNAAAEMPSAASQQSMWSDIGRWHAEGAGGVLSDSTANGHDATGYNLTPTEGVIGTGQSFNGSTSYAVASDSVDLDPLGNHSISMWFRAETINVPVATTLLAKRARDVSGYIIIIGGSALGVGRLVWDTGPAPAGRWSSNVFFEKDALYHIVLVRTTFSRFAYVNGVLAGTTSNAGTTINTPFDLYIGRDNSTSQYHLDGMIDEVRIRGSALDAAWALTEYNNQGAPGSFWTTGPVETLGGGGTPIHILRSHHARGY